MADGGARREASGSGIRLVFEPEINTQDAEKAAASALGGRVQALDENSTLGHPLSSQIGSGWAALAFSTLQDEGVSSTLNWQVVNLGRGADGSQLALIPNRIAWDVGRGKYQALYRVVHIFQAALPVVPSGYTARKPPPAAPAGPDAIYVAPPAPRGPPPVLIPVIGPNSAADALRIGPHGEVFSGGNPFFGQPQQPAPPNYGGGPWRY